MFIRNDRTSWTRRGMRVDWNTHATLHTIEKHIHDARKRSHNTRIPPWNE
jgi:hypothetical protein